MELMSVMRIPGLLSSQQAYRVCQFKQAGLPGKVAPAGLPEADGAFFPARERLSFGFSKSPESCPELAWAGE
jgi:hypothetical protein